MTGLQHALLNLETNNFVMAALGMKDEANADSSFSVHHDLLNKRSLQRKSNSATTSPSETLVNSCPSPKKEPSVPPNNHVLQHIQYIQTYEEKSPHHPCQEDTYLRVSTNDGSAIEMDRLHQFPHPSGMSGGAMDCANPVSPPQSSNPLILQSGEGGGASGNSTLKRTHGLNKASANDPLSHRIIEKRRRDRMNNCLADLSRLIPTYYLKKGRGRIEKTEIIEMAIKYMKHLQAHACSQIETCEVTTNQEKAGKEMEHFQLGYQEAMSETLEFLRDSEGLFSGDSLCVRIMNHLTKHCEKIIKNDGYVNLKLPGSLSSASSSSGYHANGSSNGSSSDGNCSSFNLGSEAKDSILTEESAYRSDDHPYSDDREMNYMSSSGGNSHHLSAQGDAGSYRPSPGPGSNTSSSGDDNGSRLYKFKSNMKHRFSADAEHSQAKKKRRDSGNYCGFSEGTKETGRRSFVPSSRQSPYSHQYAPVHEGLLSPGSHSDKANSIPSQPWATKSEGDVPNVPAFALSPSGSFYIPLSLDQSFLAPFLPSLGENGSNPVLHPVSINVNFSIPFTPVPFQSQPPGMSTPQPSIIPKMDPYSSYGERNPKEERRRYMNYNHSHTVSSYPPPTFVRGDFRNVRTTGDPIVDLQPMPVDGIPPFLHYDLRKQEPKLPMKDCYGKIVGRGHLS